jgi:hypothetical protein
VNIADAKSKMSVFMIFCCSRVEGRFVGIRKRGGIGNWRTL